MKRVVALLVIAVAALVPTGANAGGWALATLDPLPPIRAGAPLAVGFTLLQHGQTPVVAADWQGLTVGLGVMVDGERHFVTAEPSGAPGHYTATVAVPDDVGSLQVRVEMPNGLFIDETWTSLPVAAGTGSPSSWLPTWTVPLFGLGAVACAATLLTGVRRRRPAPVAAA